MMKRFMTILPMFCSISMCQVGLAMDGKESSSSSSSSSTSEKKTESEMRDIYTKLLLDRSSSSDVYEIKTNYDPMHEIHVYSNGCTRHIFPKPHGGWREVLCYRDLPAYDVASNSFQKREDALRIIAEPFPSSSPKLSQEDIDWLRKIISPTSFAKFFYDGNSKQ